MATIVDDYAVRNGNNGDVVCVANLDLCLRWVQHEAPDGTYVVSGPGTRRLQPESKPPLWLQVKRVAGTVYPQIVVGTEVKRLMDDLGRLRRERLQSN